MNPNFISDDETPRKYKATGAVWTAALLAIFAAADAQAEIGFSDRNSDLGVTWLYGYAADVRGGGAGGGSPDPKLSDGAGVVGGRFDDGIWEPTGHPWSATAAWTLTHGYAVRGSADDVTALSASGSTDLLTFSTGEALTQLTTTNNCSDWVLPWAATRGVSRRCSCARCLMKRPTKPKPSSAWTRSGHSAGHRRHLVQRRSGQHPPITRSRPRRLPRGIHGLVTRGRSKPGAQLLSIHAHPRGRRGADFLPETIPEPAAGVLLFAAGALLAGRRSRPQ